MLRYLTNKFRLFSFLSGMVIVLFVALLLLRLANMGGVDSDPNRHSRQVAEFVDQDKQYEKTQSPVVFVGSSSIRGWNLRESFPEIPSLNRGLGGAEISDLNYFVEEIALKYMPSIVVVYAGENDVVGRKPPEAILEDYRFFVDTVTARLADVSVVYISIKPTPSQWESWPKMQRANEIIRAYSKSQSNLYFVDVSEVMLNESGGLQNHLYAQDGIHLSESGYEVWTKTLTELLHSLYFEAMPDQERD